MKTNLCRVAGLLAVAVAALSAAACISPSTVNRPEAPAFSDQHWGPQPDELFPSYSYKRVGGG